MISVIIPLYNKQDSISYTINSILNQTFKDFELIVIDDGSSDNSFDVVSNIDDTRIKLYRQSNQGVSAARNFGIVNARYNYIAFIDGDDIWYPSHLEVMVNLISKYRESSVGGYTTCYYKSSSRLLIEFGQDDQSSYIIENYIVEATARSQVISSSNFVARRDYLISSGMYDTTLAYGEDVDLWLRLFKEHKLVASNMITAIYFTAAENRSVKRVMPLSKRFHNFDYSAASNDERKYFDKLVSILVLDYFMQSAYNICFSVLWRYKTRLPFILAYYLKLIFKKYFKSSI